jgi:GxxExxY protein
MDANHFADNKPFAQEGYDLMGAAFEVHRELGGGLLEEIYQEALELELAIRSIPFQAREQLKVFYKGTELKKRYIPDLFGHGKIAAELKALSALTESHEAQLVNYLRLSKSPVGYLINFGPVHQVQWKRFILSEFIPPKQ